MSRFRGLLQASVNATKRALTWNADEWAPLAEKYISFSYKDELKKWHLYSDSEYGVLMDIDLDSYVTFAMKVKTDGRSYIR